MKNGADNRMRGLGEDWQGGDDRWDIEGFNFSSFLAGVIAALFLMVIL